MTLRLVANAHVTAGVHAVVGRLRVRLARILLLTSVTNLRTGTVDGYHIIHQFINLDGFT